MFFRKLNKKLFFGFLLLIIYTFIRVFRDLPNENPNHHIIVAVDTGVWKKTRQQKIRDELSKIGGWIDFPPGFMWGVSSAAYQTEGAWNEDGKGESIWDRFVHQKPSPIKDGSTGDDACKSYQFYEKDVELVHNMNAKYYRFSISWTRILPEGTRTKVNQKGIDYYNSLINKLVQKEVNPVVTLYHWDLPQALQDHGGWLNETTIDHLLGFSQLCFDLFGDRVKLWITQNEPAVVAWMGYGTGEFAPGIKEPGELPYKVAHNLLKAHARVWHLYDQQYRLKQKGRVGITLNTDWKEPFSNNLKQEEAAERELQFMFGWVAHPIFSSSGGYPKLMKDVVKEKSQKQGLPKSRLPEFTEKEKEFIKGSWDFMGLNYYSTKLIKYKKGGKDPSYKNDRETAASHSEQWGRTGSDWLWSVPWGLMKLLNWIKNEYNNPPVLITENGVSDNSGITNDPVRIKYFQDHLVSLTQAIFEDECRVIGYMAWSLLDNFEWNNGYTEKFGLHWVNFSDPLRERRPKDSVAKLAKLFNTNRLVLRRWY